MCLAVEICRPGEVSELNTAASDHHIKVVEIGFHKCARSREVSGSAAIDHVEVHCGCINVLHDTNSPASPHPLSGLRNIFYHKL